MEKEEVTVVVQEVVVVEVNGQPCSNARTGALARFRVGQSVGVGNVGVGQLFKTLADTDSIGYRLFSASCKGGRADKKVGRSVGSRPKPTEDAPYRGPIAQQAPKMWGRTRATSKLSLALRTRRLSMRRTRLQQAGGIRKWVEGSRNSVMQRTGIVLELVVFIATKNDMICFAFIIWLSWNWSDLILVNIYLFAHMKMRPVFNCEKMIYLFHLQRYEM